jgi:hypothetical protein
MAGNEFGQRMADELVAAVGEVAPVGASRFDCGQEAHAHGYP